MCGQSAGGVRRAAAKIIHECKEYIRQGVLAASTTRLAVERDKNCRILE